MITLGFRHHFAAARKAAEACVLGDLDPKTDVLRVDISRPEQHRLRPGFAAGHPVGKATGVQDRRHPGYRQCAEPVHTGKNQLASIHHAWALNNEWRSEADGQLCTVKTGLCRDECRNAEGTDCALDYA